MIDEWGDEVVPSVSVRRLATDYERRLSLMRRRSRVVALWAATLVLAGFLGWLAG